MGIAIGATNDRSSLAPCYDWPVVDLEDDGYYWFLTPLFGELALKTGQYVDLYGDACFKGKTLDEFKRALSDARRLVNGKPDRWRVHVGTQTLPKYKELYRTVVKSDFLKLLRKLAQIANLA